MPRGGRREGAGRKPKDPTKKATRKARATKPPVSTAPPPPSEPASAGDSDDGAPGLREPLRPLHELFCREYLLDMNATQAYLRVYKCKPESADHNGPRLIRNARIRARVGELLAARMKEADVSAERVLAELSVVAFADIRSLLDDGDRLRPIATLDESVSRAISSIEVLRERTRRIKGSEYQEVTEESVVKVKYWDKLRALELIAKMRGFLIEKHEHRVTRSLEDILSESNGAPA